MGSFVQIIEFKTSKIDEIKQIAEDFRGKREAEGSGGPVTGTITEDRDRPGTYLNIVEFQSYELAMENSNHPLTQDFAKHMMELCDGPPKFYNLNVLDSWGR
jgi:hypothetical protein